MVKWKRKTEGKKGIKLKDQDQAKFSIQTLRLLNK